MNSTQNVIPITHPYLPSFPPSKSSKPSYSRFLASAPLIALADVTPHAKNPAKFEVSTSCRIRVQVGNTNRWRVPSALGSDLLGTSQAMKAMEFSNQSARKFISIDDITKHSRSSEFSYKNRYSDRMTKMRSGLHSAPAAWPNQSLRNRPVLGSRSKSTADTADKRRIGNLVKEGPLSLKNIQQLQQSRGYLSPDKRRPTPVEMFLRNVQLASKYSGVELIIGALNTTWNLHLRFAEGSQLLSNMIKEDGVLETAPRYSQEELNDEFFVTSDRQGVTVSIPRTPSYPKTVPIFLDLEVNDEFITRHAFATALCYLYDNCIELEPLDAISILAAARFLEIDPLVDRCAELMMENIDAYNACIFYTAAVKYDITIVREFCEKWLQLHAVPELSSSFCLAHLNRSLLEKLLASQQLFLYNEYELYKLLCNWVFFKQHPTLQMLPTWGAVVTWFMSIPITVSFLESDEGKQFRPLFKKLRLNGITEPGQLDEVSKMNIFPSDWLLKVFSQHYYSLQGGGDMSLLTRFEDGAIRKGFILDQPIHVFSEVISLHGFHFDVIAEMDDAYQCFIFIQRLRPTDPVLSQRISDRQTFSVRYDREVRYAIKAQYVERKSFIVHKLGPKSQCFGLSNKSERSEVLKISAPTLPIYVTFSILFPPS